MLVAFTAHGMFLLQKTTSLYARTLSLILCPKHQCTPSTHAPSTTIQKLSSPCLPVHEIHTGALQVFFGLTGSICGIVAYGVGTLPFIACASFGFALGIFWWYYASLR
jgi:hypothetical protein